MILLKTVSFPGNRVFISFFITFTDFQDNTYLVRVA